MSRSNPPSHMRHVRPLVRVLLVDDDPTVLRALRRGLSAARPDWQVNVHADAARALHHLEHEPVDVLVSDYEMPVMNGIDLFRRAKRKHPTVLRVILSGKAKERAGALAPGLVHAWLSKSQSAEELAQLLESALEHRAKSRRAPEAS